MFVEGHSDALRTQQGQQAGAAVGWGGRRSHQHRDMRLQKKDGPGGDW